MTELIMANISVITHYQWWKAVGYIKVNSIFVSLFWRIVDEIICNFFWSFISWFFKLLLYFRKFLNSEDIKVILSYYFFISNTFIYDKMSAFESLSHVLRLYIDWWENVISRLTYLVISRLVTRQNTKTKNHYIGCRLIRLLDIFKCVSFHCRSFQYNRIPTFCHERIIQLGIYFERELCFINFVESKSGSINTRFRFITCYQISVMCNY